MKQIEVEPRRIRNAWMGRISGCQLGKPVEVLALMMLERRATVGALWGLTGKPIPAHWTDPWQGRVAVLLAGVGELSLDDLVDRTVALARRLSA